MGAHAWFYFVPYEEDLTKSLETLREREFKAGRYTPVERFPRFPVDSQHQPGSKHSSIEAARAAAGASGTRSILDIGGPGEGFWIIIGVGEEAVDGGLEFDNRAEHSALEGGSTWNPSTALSHEAEVGVQWNTKRG